MIIDGYGYGGAYCRGSDCVSLMTPFEKALLWSSLNIALVSKSVCCFRPCHSLI